MLLIKVWVSQNLSHSNFLKLPRVQNEAMGFVLGEEEWRLSKVIAKVNAMQNPTIPLHDAVKERNGCRLARGKSWIGQEEQPFQSHWAHESMGLGNLSSTPTTRLFYHKTWANTKWLAGKNQEYKRSKKQTASHIASWSTRMTQSRRTSLVGVYQSSRTEELYKKTVANREAWPPVTYQDIGYHGLPDWHIDHSCH